MKTLNEIKSSLSKEFEQWKDNVLAYCEEDEETGLTCGQLTIAYNAREWGWQTGDNSFIGGAYTIANSEPWVVLYFSADSTLEDILSDFDSQV